MVIIIFIDCFVDVRDQYGQTVLMHATILNDVEMLKILYRAGKLCDQILHQ